MNHKSYAILLVFCALSSAAISGCYGPGGFTLRIENDGPAIGHYEVTISYEGNRSVVFAAAVSVDEGQHVTMRPEIPQAERFLVDVMSHRGYGDSFDLSDPCGSCQLWVQDDGTRFMFMPVVYD